MGWDGKGWDGMAWHGMCVLFIQLALARKGVAPVFAPNCLEVPPSGERASRLGAPAELRYEREPSVPLCMPGWSRLFWVEPPQKHLHNWMGRVLLPEA